MPRTVGRSIENTGTTDLVFVELFKADTYEDVSLSQWMRQAPAKRARIPETNRRIVPG